MPARTSSAFRPDFAATAIVLSASEMSTSSTMYAWYRAAASCFARFGSFVLIQ